MSTKILLADDHRLVREGIRRILDAQPDVSVVAEASNGQEAVDRTLEILPDLALIDITMPRLSGIEAIRRIRKAGVATRCLANQAMIVCPGAIRNSRGPDRSVARSVAISAQSP